MGKCPDVCKIFRGKGNCLNGDSFAGFDHFFQFVFGSGSNHMTVIHNGDSGTDLFHFFHVMGSINNGGTLFIQLLDPFQNLITALGINSYSWLIHNDQPWLMGDSAGNVQSAEKTAGKLFRPHFSIVVKVSESDCFLYQLFSFLFIRDIKPTEIVNVFVNSQFVENSNILQYNADLLFYLVIVRSHFFSENTNDSFVVFQKGKHTIDSCGFSGTIWSQKTKNFPF